MTLRHSIPFQRQVFDEDAIERCGSGAGIVLYSVNDAGETVFLLGRERLSTWKGSCRWSGFEGSRKEGETLAAAAVREFREESMDALLPPDEVARIIREKEYELCVVLSVHSERKENRYHRTFLVRVDWKGGDEEASFAAVRSRLEYVERLTQEWQYTRPTALRGVHAGAVEREAREAHAEDGAVSPTERCVRVARTDEAADGGGGASPLVVRGAEADRVLSWVVVRDRLTRATFDHPALLVQHEAGVLRDVVVVKDFLEKDRVRWWSAAELVEVLNNRGTVGAERFRPYFLPVMQIILAELGCVSVGERAQPSPRSPCPEGRGARCEPCAPWAP
jgi:predicted NUDIX family NTP pyrophosphohydrolase